MKDQCDAEALIEELSGSPVRMSGQSLKTKCFLPGHRDNTPSFNYSPRRGTWKCFGCGRGGDVISLVQEAMSLDFNSSVSWLSSRFGFKEPDWKGDVDMTDEYRHRLRVYNAGNAYIKFCREGREKIMERYMEERGQSGLLAKLYRVGFHPPGVLVSHIDLSLIGLQVPGAPKGKSLLEGRVVIPHLLGYNQPIGFYGRKSRHCTNKSIPKYINSYDTPVYQKGLIMFNGDRVKNSIDKKGDIGVIIPEGQFDCMAIPGYAAAPGGTSTTPHHFEYVRDYLGSSSVILMKDGDAAGFKAARRDITLGLKSGLAVYLCPPPDGSDLASIKKDINVEPGVYVDKNRIGVAEFMMKYLPTNEHAKIDEVLRTINASPNTSIQRELLKRLSFCTSQSLYGLTKRATEIQRK